VVLFSGTKTKGYSYLAYANYTKTIAYISMNAALNTVIFCACGTAQQWANNIQWKWQALCVTVRWRDRLNVT